MQNLPVFKLFGLILLLAVAMTSCEKEEALSMLEETTPMGVAKQLPPLETSEECDAVIDFNGLLAGTTVNTLSSGFGVSGAMIPGSVAVMGRIDWDDLSPVGGINYGMIFDTDNPTGDDEDLDVDGRDYQEVLIVSEDLDADDPDDAAQGGMLMFDFSGFGSGEVTIYDFITIDNEKGGEYEALDADGNVVVSGTLAMIPDATDQVVTLNAAGVEQLTVTFYGSGAMDNICIGIEQEEEAGCTLTQGFWQNIKKGDWPEPYDREDIFYGSGQTWQMVLKSPVKGNAYYQAAHQYIAAVLNIANGASAPDEVDAAISLAMTLFSTYTPAQIAGLKGNDPLRQQFIAISEILDAYNKGEIGPGHCDD